MRKPYPVDVEAGQTWKNKHCASMGRIKEVKEDDVIFYDVVSDYEYKLSIDELMQHWIWIDKDVFELLFNEVDSALCHLMTVIEAHEVEHADFGCAAKHIGRITHMAEQILGEKAAAQTQAWSMTQRIENEKKWKRHGGKKEYDKLVAERIAEMQKE
jgi:hypothetical protein